MRGRVRGGVKTRGLARELLEGWGCPLGRASWTMRGWKAGWEESATWPPDPSRRILVVEGAERKVIPSEGPAVRILCGVEEGPGELARGQDQNGRGGR